MKIDLGDPRFSFESSVGPTSLREQMGPEGLLVYFMREFACTHCQAHVAKLVEAAAGLKARGVQVLVIGGGSVNSAEKLAKRYSAPFAIAADKGRGAYDAFDLDRTMGFWQKSGSFLLTPSGEVVYELRSTMPKGLNLEELEGALKGRVVTVG